MSKQDMELTDLDASAVVPLMIILGVVTLAVVAGIFWIAIKAAKMDPETVTNIGYVVLIPLTILYIVAMIREIRNIRKKPELNVK